MQSNYDVIVIGSGFGGAISAMRCAAAGKSVLLLERGKHYKSGHFPRISQQSASLFWRYPQTPESQGLYDYKVFSGLGVVAASGVGGGSLLYANVHDIPSASVFEHDRWPDQFSLDYLQPFYDKVSQKMSLQRTPDDKVIPKHQLFSQAAAALDYKVESPAQAVNWSTCTYCSECEIGCQYGAKQSLDKNYLADALQAGAELKARANVYLIEPTFHGYYVHFSDLADGGKKKQVKARVVVVSAGTIGTNELLLRSRDQYQALPKISHRLGQGFSANGDFLGSVQGSDKRIESWNGPSVTSVMRVQDDDDSFNIVAPTLSQAMTEVLSAIGQPDGKLLRFLGPLFWQHMAKWVPTAFEKDWLAKPRRWNRKGHKQADHFTNLFAMGQDNANGRFQLKRGKLDIEWDYYAENKATVDATLSVLQRVADQYGGSFSPFFTWNMAQKTTTVHPLGGCAMGSDEADSVVSSYGQVHGYPGLFISDGSIIPTALGCYPAMTIAALAEHNAEAIAASINTY